MTVKPFPFFSGALNSRKTCYVYLPPDYELHTARFYPVLYLLHGMHGTESDWTEKGNAHLTADRMILAGELRDCIIVMPNDGEYGNGTFYMDWYDGTGNFEQYMIYDLIQYIDNHFRTLREREARAIAGFSMGGFGAFFLSMRHPDLFVAAASLSGALGTPTVMPFRDFERSQFPRILGPLHGEYVRQTDLLELSAKLVKGEVWPTLYFNCGEQDPLYPLNVAFHKHLNSVGYRHEFEAFPGEHNWTFSAGRLPEVLRFMDRCFKV